MAVDVAYDSFLFPKMLRNDHSPHQKARAAAGKEVTAYLDGI